MAITIDNDILHLQTLHTSYILCVKDGRLLHLYWGARLENPDVRYTLRADVPRVSFDLPETYLPLEAPTPGRGYYGEPSLSVLREKTGDDVTELRFVSATVMDGRPDLSPLPCADGAGVKTLAVLLRDAVTALEVTMYYTVLEREDVLCLSRHIVNTGTETLTLTRAQAASLHFDRDGFDLLHLPGAWARERHLVRRKLARGEAVLLRSARGASGHANNPAAVLARPETTEDTGLAYGLTWLYSGDFQLCAQEDAYGCTRLSLGMNPETFRWRLHPGEDFQTPEAALCCAPTDGLNGLSDRMHRFVRGYITPARWRGRPRPILINNWEATYFHFDEQKILAIAAQAAQLGVELFVLDDGWFGRRNDDTTSLGDWRANLEKLPAGLGHLIDGVRALGLQFGLWFEPEMVSPDSDLYRAHPDWCLHAEDRARTTARSQLILDLSRSEVAEYVYHSVADLLHKHPITYVKWDMNRNMTEGYSPALAPDRQQETHHRYMLNLYRVFARLTEAFPDVLFEGCSGGGGRFDLGILRYMPQIWTSDDTDPVERLKIQYGTSLFYPPCTMGAHVSASPNHQTGRVTPIKTRGLAALSGNFGFELDLGTLTEEEKTACTEMIARVKRLRPMLADARMTRLLSPFDGPLTAWQLTAPDASLALVCCFRTLARPNGEVPRVYPVGLCPTAMYREAASGERYTGQMLMRVGLPLLVPQFDFDSLLLEFIREDA